MSGGKSTIFIRAHGRPQPQGVKNGSQGHGSFVVTNPDNTNKVLPSCTSISGIVANVDVHTTGSGEDTSHSFFLQIEDAGDPPIRLSLTLGSLFSAEFVGLVNAADLSRPISICFISVLKGEQFGSGISERDHVFPIIRGANNARLSPIWANGLKALPEPPLVKVNGKVLPLMDPVNEVVGATLNEIYRKHDVARASRVPA